VHEAEVRELRAKIGELVYAWADGIYVRAGLEQEKAGRCRSSSGRCATGARKSWPSVPGYRESTDSWRGVLRGEGKLVLRRGVGAAGPWTDARHAALCENGFDGSTEEQLERAWMPPH